MRSFLDFYTMAQPGWPPLNMIVFPILLIGCCTYALWRGGQPEKIAAIVLTSGCYLTFGAAWQSGGLFRSVEIGIFVVDLLCLIGLAAIALCADRFWPLWIAACQLIGTAGHAARLADAAIVPRTYAFMLAIWAYPMIVLIIVGTSRHQKRLARFGADPPWSPWKIAD